MTIRPKSPLTPASRGLALLVAGLSCAALCAGRLRAQEPLTGAALYRPVRPAVAPRSVADVGYFQPLYEPPKTQAVLERVVEFDILEQPMDLFFADVERATGVRFVLDEAGLAEAAITADAEISGRSAGMSLDVALGVLLRDVDLVCVPGDGHVLITSRESAEYEIETRLYALADHPLLRGADADPWWLAEVVRQHAESGDRRGHEPCHVSLLPGAVAVTGTRQFQERAGSLLRQHGRLLGEHDATASPESDDRDDAAPPEEPDVVTVVRATKPYDLDAGFRLLTPRPRSAAFLDGLADFEAVRKPLESLLAEIESDIGVRFEFDESLFEPEEAPLQEKVTFRAKGLTYATALSLILRALDLKFVPQDDRVLVMSNEVELPLETREYEPADHPLLRGDLGASFARELEIHLADGRWGLPEECLVELCDDVLTLRADAATLDRADAILRQYARLLVEFDAFHDPPLAGTSTSYRGSRSKDEGRPAFCFRSMAERPWTEFALQKPAEMAVVDMPLTSIVLQVEQATGAPCLLDESGLDDAAITSDAELTFQAAPEETYADALSRILGEHDLAYVPRDHYVWITSPGYAAFAQQTRLYAVHFPPDLDDAEGGLCWQIEQHLRGSDPERHWPAMINLLPGALVVTENPRRLALVEQFLSKHGLAPPEYTDKPAGSSDDRLP
ncbi:MAG TPA: hypothetical protein VGN57_03060 [Pirellulaceae bacterium]|nr:hypothetical protein [Pirellulaceae bacterium]